MSDDFDDPAKPGIAASILNALENRRAMAPPRRRATGIAMIVAVIAIFAGVVWYSYPREAAEQGADVPLVKADAGPYKETPEDPGGMDIPNRDSTVFDTLRADADGQQVEHLLPPAEQPLPHEQVFAGLKTEVPVTEMQTPQPKETVVEAKPEEPVKEEVKEAQAPEAKKLPETAPASGVETAAPKGGEAKGYFAQLGSMRSEKDAQSAWTHMKKAYASLFGDTPYRVQQADLGAKGTYYRLQAGPVTEARAREICDGVGGKKGGCLVIKR
jgi:cell division septation protein DedD